LADRASAFLATLWIDAAISSIDVSVSSAAWDVVEEPCFTCFELAAICSADDAVLPAVCRMSLIRPLRSPTILFVARPRSPSSSFVVTSTVCVRSPDATFAIVALSTEIGRSAIMRNRTKTISEMSAMAPRDRPRMRTCAFRSALSIWTVESPIFTVPICSFPWMMGLTNSTRPALFFGSSTWWVIGAPFLSWITV
jgi:hypothetical protein